MQRLPLDQSLCIAQICIAPTETASFLRMEFCGCNSSSARKRSARRDEPQTGDAATVAR
jgi:hypothetical protein